MIGEDAVGDLLEEDRLAGAGRCDDHAALAEAERSDQVDDPHIDFFAGRLETDAALGMQGRQIVEADLFAQLVRVFEVDRLDAQEREVTLVFLGWPDLPGDDGAGLEAEAADLAGGNVDVVRAGKVIVVGAAQEAEAVGQDLERPFAVHQAVLLDALFEDLEDQILLFEPHVLDDALALGSTNELRHRHFLKLGEMDLAALDVFIAIVEGGVAEDIFFFVGEFRGNVDVRRRRRAFGPHRRRVVAIAGRKRDLAFGALAIISAEIRIAGALAATTEAGLPDCGPGRGPALEPSGYRRGESGRRRARRGRGPSARALTSPARARPEPAHAGVRGSRLRMKRIGSRSAGASSRCGSLVVARASAEPAGAVGRAGIALGRTGRPVLVSRLVACRPDWFSNARWA